MSAEAEKVAKTAVAKTETKAEASLLDQVLANGVVERDWLGDFLDRLPTGRQKGVTQALKKMIQDVEEKLSKQLAAVMHAPEFLKLEGTWRGLHYLVQNTETCATLKVKMLHLTKREVFTDLDTATEFDQSQLWKRVYQSEFDTPNGEPFGALVGDYEFENNPDDISLLRNISGVAAGALCPFISAASPQMFQFKSWTQLNDTRDLGSIFETKAYTKWQSFRDTTDSRFVVLTFPRVMARSPYGKNSTKVDFNYQEVPLDDKDRDQEMPHDHYCWMNCAWTMAARMTDAFAKTNWCTTIRGYGDGGKVENLPAHVYQSARGGERVKCPTEVLIPGRRDAEISKQGFLALCNYKDTDYSVFYGAQTCHKPQKFRKDADTENEAISSRLPYLMAASRISHYLKVLGRDKEGGFMEASDCQEYLHNWVMQWVTDDPKPSASVKARFPLAQAEVLVKKIPGKPGAYNATVKLRPWLQLEELNAAVGMVAEINTAK